MFGCWAGGSNVLLEHVSFSSIHFFRSHFGIMPEKLTPGPSRRRMRVTIRISHAPSRILYMNPLTIWTVHQLKIFFMADALTCGHRHAVPACIAHVRFYHRGEELRDGTRLFETDIEDGDEVALFP